VCRGGALLGGNWGGRKLGDARREKGIQEKRQKEERAVGKKRIGPPARKLLKKRGNPRKGEVKK